MTNQTTAFADKLYEIAKNDKNTYFCCADGMEYYFLLDRLRKDFPERFVRTGISEANTISVASGLALSGKTVFVLIMSVFASNRAYEQIRLDVGYNCANVKILALKSGLKFNVNAGYSHYGVEDKGLMRAIPNLTVLTPSTCEELECQLDYAYKTKGAFYIRLENIHSSFSLPLANNINKISKLTKGNDVAIVADGSMAEFAYSFLYKNLKHANIYASIYNACAFKPFDEKTIIDLIDKKIPIVTIEEQIEGGLGTVVSEIIARHGKAIRFLPLRINNENYNIAGDYDYLAQKLMGKDDFMCKIVNFTDKKISFFKIPVITFKSCFEENGFCRSLFFKLLGFLPLIKLKYRRKCEFKKGKPSFKMYLFGFVRIL